MVEAGLLCGQAQGWFGRGLSGRRVDGSLEQVPFAPVTLGGAHVVDLSVVQTHHFLYHEGPWALG